MSSNSFWRWSAFAAAAAACGGIVLASWLPGMGRREENRLIAADAGKSIEHLLAGGETTSPAQVNASIARAQSVLDRAGRATETDSASLHDPFAAAAVPAAMTAAPTPPPPAGGGNDRDRLAVLKAEQALHLESVFGSAARRACVINDAVYLEGQTVGGFTIEKITTDAVVIRSGTYRFELAVVH